jgi:hypothetical protein
MRKDPAALVDRLGDEERRSLEWALVCQPVGDSADWLAMAGAIVARDGVSELLARRLAEVAPMMSESEALHWAATLRERDLAGHCPLVARARSVSLDAMARLRSAAIALEVFGDDDDTAALALGAAAAVTDEDLERMLLVLDELAPDALGLAVLGAATTPVRMLALAALLERFGAPEQADALRDAAQEAVRGSSTASLGRR